MRSLALLIAFALAAPAHAHRGHDHSHDPWPTMSAPASFPWPVVALFVVAGSLGLGARRSRKIALVCPLAALLLCDFGCGGPGASKKHPPQPRHDAVALAQLFEPFQKDGVTVRSDADFLYVESNAFPSHPMMVGITAWQQQVPLPQPYTGKNAWRLPLQPVVADQPISAKTAFFRGAIALAVNGVPIFNALNNRGEDAYLAGELDEYGGHCGRGDDYHYHIAPVHLEKTVGRGNPIAFALDGFPIHGYTDADGNEPTGLDEFHGRFERDGTYRYYASKKYPYINGGLRGLVSVRGDQIDPQPKDAPARPALQPLSGATITAFERQEEAKTYTVRYERHGKTSAVRYTLHEDATVTFVYVGGDGERTETYRRKAMFDRP